MEIDATHLENLAQRQMFDDPSGGIFNKRIMFQFFMMAQNSNMSEKERGDVFDLLHVIALKFVSVWTHDQRFEKRQNEMLAASEAQPVDRRINKPMRFASAQDLYIEWDGFLVQSKSVLDHMINILHYTMNVSFSSLSTFGDNGNKIINILKRNAPFHCKNAAAALVKHIERNQEWLKSMIDARDRMNHFIHGGINPQSFGVAVIIEKDGVKRHHVPRFNETQTAKEVMTNLLGMLLEFVEYFMGISMACRMPSYGVQWNSSDDPLKARWSMVPSVILQHLMDTGQLKDKPIT